MSFSFRTSFVLYFFITTIAFLSLRCGVSNPGRYSGFRDFSKITPVVRILINEPADNIDLSINDDITLIADGKEIKNLSGNLHFSSSGQGIEVSTGSRKLSSNSLIIRPDEYFTFGNKKLSGDIKVISLKNQIYLLNTPSVEDYLKGVIPYEMPLGKGDEYYEGLKAFAICARTFTLKKIAEGNSSFDVRTDERDQVYGGLSGRKQISDRVVDETRGMVLSYYNQTATIFYFSTCGGVTEDAENVFNTKPFTYLKSVTDPYCSISPQAQWTETFTPARIIALLKRASKINSTDFNLLDMRINSRFKSGRVNELEILLTAKDRKEKSVLLNGNNIRFVLLQKKNQVLNSSYFDLVKTSNGEYTIKGKGWGHGTGLCQWGALGQSLKGRSYEQILSFYFPGTQIMRQYD